MKRTALVADRRYLDHFAGRIHPERPERIGVLLEMAAQLRRPDLQPIAPREALIEELALCHSQEYIAEVERTAAFERSDFDPDTHASAATWQTARLAAGGVLTAIEAVLAEAADNAFALVRPPGHHARPNQAMGFCFFNNVAIGAQALLSRHGLHRVLILDWDVHHGNGTQELFFDTDEVLYISTHQSPFYPGTGQLDEIGRGRGTGYTLNVPLPAGCGDDEYLRVFDDLLMPVARQFAPEFVLVSAGFDAHYRDPLGGMSVTEQGFAAMTRRLQWLAAEFCAGRLVAVLEGGYDLRALSASSRAVIEELGRDDAPRERAASGGRVIPIIERAQHFQQAHRKRD